jgi:hypothetical protein
MDEKMLIFGEILTIHLNFINKKYPKFLKTQKIEISAQLRNSS